MCTIQKKLDGAMDTIIEVFQSYAGKGGDRFKLNFVELKNLIQTEMNIKDSWDLTKVLAIMDDLDKNKDGNVSFEEFMCLITKIALYKNAIFKNYTPMDFQCGQIGVCGVGKM
nr:PREDICTED: protein S100-A1-like [Paralichthys olivaceus]XP_019961346.1 PREDICTED: protein S100-A1-like [Paralichthys olivaceus]